MSVWERLFPGHWEDSWMQEGIALWYPKSHAISSVAGLVINFCFLLLIILFSGIIPNCSPAKSPHAPSSLDDRWVGDHSK